jgi:glycosyltransferase involved in cell wall biosynthesis
LKILFVTTISNTVNAFLIPHIDFLVKQGHQVDVAYNIVQEVNPELTELGCTVHNVSFQRSPLNKKNYLAYKKIKELIKKEDYDIVHTHTPVASTCVRLACRRNEKVKILYTAHGFHFFKGAPLPNWLIYYPIEKWLSKYTDVLITINREDYERAKKSFKAERIEQIPGIGLNTKRINNLVVNKCDKLGILGIPRDAFVLLSVGELNKNKNHETAIKALAKLNNPNVYYVICGEGPLKENLNKLTVELGVEKQVKLLGFRRDIAEFYKVADVFVFPSYREGLPVALMESMVAGLPVVCSGIRGNSDLIDNEKGGCLVSPSDFDMFAEVISKLINDKKVCSQMGLYNKEKIKKFDINIVSDRMGEIYNCINVKDHKENIVHFGS